MSFPSDLEIARSVTPRPIVDVAHELGPPRRRDRAVRAAKAKVTLAAIERLEAAEPAGQVRRRHRRSRPTPLGEGKSTTTVGLAQGLNRIGHRAAVAIRQPIARAGLRDQGRRRRRRLQPGHPDGGLQPPPDRRRPRHRGRPQPRRGVPRQLASTTTTRSGSTRSRSSGRASSTSATGRSGGRSSGSAVARTAPPRETEWQITVASEVMAVLALASDLARPARAARPDGRRHDAGRHAGHRRGPQGRRRDDGPAPRRDQAEPAPDARGRSGLRPLRPVRATSPTATTRSSPTGWPWPPTRSSAPRPASGPTWAPRSSSTSSAATSGLRPDAAVHRGDGPGPEDARRRRQDRRRQAARPGPARRRTSRRSGAGAAEPRQADRERPPLRRPGRSSRSTPSRPTRRPRSRPSARWPSAAGARDAVVATHFADGGAGAEALAAGGLGSRRGRRARLPLPLSGRRAAAREDRDDRDPDLRRRRGRVPAPGRGEGAQASIEESGLRQPADLHGQDAVLAEPRPDAQGPADGLPRPDPRRPPVGRGRLRDRRCSARCGRCPGCPRIPGGENIDIDAERRTSSGCSRTIPC